MTSRLRICAAALTLLAAATLGSASAQPRPRERSEPFTPRVIALAPAKEGAVKLTVNSADFAGQNYKDKRFFQTVVGGQNMAPGVEWSAGPAGTQSYVVFMEGEGGERADPTVHWVVYDIPATATKLPTGVPKEPAQLKEPAGALQGREDSSVFRGKPDGEPGYRGPNYSASGGSPHPYYFEVFALDTKLGIDPAKALRRPVVEAMKGHVLASGEFAVKFGAEHFAGPK
jgi:Raf kinase inhibitor-like YbhB/YbcL family protein